MISYVHLYKNVLKWLFSSFCLTVDAACSLNCPTFLPPSYLLPWTLSLLKITPISLQLILLGIFSQHQEKESRQESCELESPAGSPLTKTFCQLLKKGYLEKNSRNCKEFAAAHTHLAWWTRRDLDGVWPRGNCKERANNAPSPPPPTHELSVIWMPAKDLPC